MSSRASSPVRPAPLRSDPSRAGPHVASTLAWVAAAALSILAAALVLDAVVSVIRLYSPLPYQDEWDSLGLYRRLVSGEVPASEFFAPHNEHRIVFPRLIFFADYAFMGGRGRFDLFWILGIQSIETAVLLTILVRTLGLQAWSGSVAAVVAAVMFSLSQFENFMWGFQVTVVGVFGCATLAVTCFAKAFAAPGRVGRAWLIGAYAAAVVATFSMANGIATGLVMALQAIMLRRSLATIVTVAVLALVLLGAFFYHLNVPEDRVPLVRALHKFGRLSGFVAIYIGSIFGQSTTVAREFGYCGLGIAGVASIGCLAWRDVGAARVALLGIMVFCVASAALTAYGRFELGPDQALAPRYSTGSCLFWSAALIFGALTKGPPTIRPTMQTLVVLLGAVLLTGVVSARDYAKPAMKDWSFNEAQSANLILTGLLDEPALEHTRDDLSVVSPQVTFLRAHRLSVFHGPDGEMLGRPIAALGRLAGAEECQGKVGAAVPLRQTSGGGVAVGGEVAAPARAGLRSRVYLTDAAQTVIGFATLDPRTAGPVLWRGYARAAPNATLVAYAVLSDHRLCRLNAAVVSDPGGP